MKTFLFFLNKIYAYLLRCYPPFYREEFAEEMLLDFSALAADAGRKGIFSLIIFCLRELIDFPVNLLRVHFEEDQIFRMVCSQPVNIGLRSALGFGIAFGLTLPITMFAYQLLAPIEKLVTHLQVFYYDLFHAEQGFDMISWIPSALSSLFTGLVLGLLFAILFADRSRYPRFILAGLLGWFFYRAMHDLLTIHFNFWVFLEGNQYSAFNYLQMAFSGAIFGLIFVVANSKGPQPIRLLIISLFVYPLLTYLFVEQLFNLFVFRTPWRFVGSAVLLVALVISVFILARKIDSGRKIPLIVIAGAVGYPLILYMGHFLPWPILPSLALPDQFDYSISAFWRRIFIFAIEQAIYGTLFGLLLGLVFGFQKKNSRSSLTA